MKNAIRTTPTDVMALVWLMAYAAGYYWAELIQHI